MQKELQQQKIALEAAQQEKDRLEASKTQAASSNESDEIVLTLKSEIRALQEKMIFLSDEFVKIQAVLANSGFLGGSTVQS